jgi:membrane fusion protein, multidrug efflux system
MNSTDPQNNTPLFKISGERIALLLGGALVGVLILGFSFKMATPIVKRVCQSILVAPEKAGRQARVIAVEAVVVKPGTISRRINTVGKLRANESVVLRSEMVGRIKEIAFKEGTKVKKGDILIRFEDDEHKAELDKAEADVEYREVKFGRLEALQKKNLGRGTEYDENRGQLNMARAQVEVAKTKLEKTIIYAPFDGTIGLIDVSVGAFVDTQKELVTLVDFDPMKIDFKAPEKFIHDIGVGQTAEVKLDSMPGQVLIATVEAINSTIDPLTHSIAVRATIPNEDEKLRAGLFGHVSIIVGVKNDALLIPESALSREGEIEFVWVVVNGKAGRKRVLTGTKENGQVEITAGLRPSEVVVISGVHLSEGISVKITNMGGNEVEVPEEDENEDEADHHTAEKEPSQSPEKATEPVKEGDQSTEAPKAAEALEKATELVKEDDKRTEASKTAETPEKTIPSVNESAKPAEAETPSVNTEKKVDSGNENAQTAEEKTEDSTKSKAS